MEVASSPVITSSVIIPFQLLIKFRNQSEISVTGTVLVCFERPCRWVVDVNNLFKYHALAIGFPSGPFHERKVNLRNVAVAEQSLAEVGSEKCDTLGARELRQRKDRSGNHLTI